MPEGPEVRVMADQIMKVIGKPIRAGFISNRALSKQKGKKDLRKPILYEWNELEVNTPIKDITTKGKKIFIWLRTQCLVVSMGMEGRIFFSSDFGNYPPNTHYVLEFAKEELVYSNTRFPIGGIDIKSYAKAEEIIDELGWDVLEEPPPFALFQEMIEKRKRKNVCTWLLDQNDLCGIGNYLVSEILYLARIHPDTKLGDLSLQQQKDLYRQCFDLPWEVYQQGGTTIRSYVDVEGKKGRYFPLIYGRKRFTDEGYQVESMKSKAGRTVYFVADKSYY